MASIRDVSTGLLVAAVAGCGYGPLNLTAPASVAAAQGGAVGLNLGWDGSETPRFTVTADEPGIVTHDLFETDAQHGSLIVAVDPSVPVGPIRLHVVGTTSSTRGEVTMELRVRGPVGVGAEPFGPDGKRVLDAEAGAFLSSTSDGDGAVLVAGELETDTGSQMVIERRTADGAPDPAFGTEGRVTLSLCDDTDDVAVRAVRDAQGRVVVVGSTHCSGTTDVAVVRLMPDGAVDTRFGPTHEGSFVLDLGGNESGVSVLPDPNGVWIGATQLLDVHSAFVVARLRDDGTLDSNFGGGAGVVITPFADDAAGTLVGLVIEPDGTLVGAGTIGDPPAIGIVHWDAQGAVLTSQTTLVGANDQVNAVAARADGTVLVGGSSNDGTNQFDWLLAALSPDGELDQRFGNRGVLIQDVGSDTEAVRALTLDEQGNIWAAGWSVGVTSDFVATRFSPDGRVDPTAAFLRADFGGDDVAYGIGLDVDTVTIAGGGEVTPGSRSPALWRLWR